MSWWKLLSIYKKKKAFHIYQPNPPSISLTKQPILLWKSKNLLTLEENQIIISNWKIKCMSRWNISSKEINILKTAFCRNRKLKVSICNRLILTNRELKRRSQRRLNIILIWIQKVRLRIRTFRSLEEVKHTDLIRKKVSNNKLSMNKINRKNWNKNLEITFVST